MSLLLTLNIFHCFFTKYHIKTFENNVIFKKTFINRSWANWIMFSLPKVNINLFVPFSIKFSMHASILQPIYLYRIVMSILIGVFIINSSCPLFSTDSEVKTKLKRKWKMEMGRLFFFLFAFFEMLKVHFPDKCYNRKWNRKILLINPEKIVS